MSSPPGNQFNPVTFGPDGNLYTAVGTGPSYNTIERYNGTTGAFMGTFAVRTDQRRADHRVPQRLHVRGQRVHQPGAAIRRHDRGVPGRVRRAGSGGINGPYGMAFGPDGNLYVSGRNSNNVVEYNGTTGAYIRTFVAAGSGGLSLPEGIDVRPERAVPVRGEFSGTNQVLKYNAQTGAYVGVAASAGLGSTHDVKFGADGLLYVLERREQSHPALHGERHLRR